VNVFSQKQRQCPPRATGCDAKHPEADATNCPPMHQFPFSTHELKQKCSVLVGH
jgi:hypothetical protein